MSICPTFNRLWIGGQYRNNGISPVIPHLYENGNSATAFTSTGAGFAMCFLIGWNLSTGNLAGNWISGNNTTGNIFYDRVSDICISKNTGRLFITGTISPNGTFPINNLNNLSSGPTLLALSFNMLATFLSSIGIFKSL